MCRQRVPRADPVCCLSLSCTYSQSVSRAQPSFQELWRKAFGQPTVQRDGLQGFFPAADTGADARLSFLPHGTPKGHSFIGLKVRDPARIPESGSVHRATEQKVEKTGVKS